MKENKKLSQFIMSAIFCFEGVITFIAVVGFILYKYFHGGS